MKLLPAALLLCPLAFCACATTSGGRPSGGTDWIAIAPAFEPAKTKTVPSFSSGMEVGRPYLSIGLLHSPPFNPNDRRAEEKYTEDFRRVAAQYGADAVIAASQVAPEVDDPFTPLGQKKEPQANLSGVAIKYVENITPEQKRRLENWDRANNRW